MAIKIVSNVWYAKRNQAYTIAHGEKGILLREEFALTPSQVTTHTKFKKVKPQPIKEEKYNESNDKKFKR